MHDFLKFQNIFSFLNSTQLLPKKGYFFQFFDGKEKFTLEKYLGGYYRDFIPKIPRRISRRRFDDDVNTLHIYSWGTKGLNTP